jgi:hypothetical protein
MPGVSHRVFVYVLLTAYQAGWHTVAPTQMRLTLPAQRGCRNGICKTASARPIKAAHHGYPPSHDNQPR